MAESIPKKHRRLVLGAAINWAAFVVALLISFFMAPYLIRVLGDGPYGLWIFVESILAYLTLFDLGIASCVVRYVAKFESEDNPEDRNRLISTSLILFLRIAGVVLLIGTTIILFLQPAFIKFSVPLRDGYWFAGLMLLNLAATLPLSVFPSILDGLQRFTTKSLVRIGSLAARTIGTLIWMEHDPSLLGIAIVYTACNLIEHGLLIIIVRRFLPDLRFFWNGIDPATWKRVKDYSVYAFISMISGRVCVQSGPILIGILLTAPQVTWFALASRLVEFAKAFLRSATNTLTPAISSLEAAGRYDDIREIFRNGSRWVLYLMVPIQLVFIYWGRPFLQIWLGASQYAVHCYEPLVIMASTLVLVVAQSVASRMLYGMGQLKNFSRWTIVEAVLNVVLSLVLILNGWEIVGVAWGVAIANFVVCIGVIGLTLKLLRFSLFTYLWKVWFLPIVFSAVPLGIWQALGWNATSWLELMICVGAGLIPYIFLVLVLEVGRKLHKFFGAGHH